MTASADDVAFTAGWVMTEQIMPDHIHAVLRVRRRLEKPLGEHLRGFKIGCTKLARQLGVVGGGGVSCSGIDARVPVRGEGAAEINYRGMRPAGVEQLVAQAVKVQMEP